MALESARLISNVLGEPDPRIQRAAEGDRVAAHGLLTELLPRVRNLVRYLTRGDADVDDISQHVLLEILRSLKTYRATGSLSGWSDRITVRVTMRRRKRSHLERTQHEGAAADLRVVGRHGAAPDEYLTRRDVVRFLDGLPEEQRQAVVLHHVVGMSVPEIAGEAGISAETVRSRLRLGMGRLRALDEKRGCP